jgi:hypothetical protein
MLPSSPAATKTAPESPQSNIKSILAVTPDTSRRPSSSKSRRLTIDPSRVSRPSSTVKFGANMSALYDVRDPPNRFELLPNNMATGCFANGVDEPLVYDEETRRNEAMLAEWDDLSDASSDRSSLDSDSGFVQKVVKEEEIQYLIPDSPIVNARRRGKRDRRSRLVKQVDVVCCKYCNRGVIRTTEFIYE